MSIPYTRIEGNDINKMYVVIMYDIDAPSPSSSDKPFVHWLVGDIRKGDIKKGYILIEYMPPSPPSGTHRYIYEIYEQMYPIANGVLQEKYINRASFPLNDFIHDYELTLTSHIQTNISSTDKTNGDHTEKTNMDHVRSPRRLSCSTCPVRKYNFATPEVDDDDDFSNPEDDFYQDELRSPTRGRSPNRTPARGRSPNRTPSHEAILRVRSPTRIGEVTYSPRQSSPTISPRRSPRVRRIPGLTREDSRVRYIPRPRRSSSRELTRSPRRSSDDPRFLADADLTDNEKSYCACTLDVASKNSSECNANKEFGYGRCYNPYAVCAKSTGTTYGHCSKALDYNNLTDQQLRAAAELKRIRVYPFDRQRIINNLIRLSKK